MRMRRRPRIHQATPPRRRDRIDRQALTVSHLARPLTLTLTLTLTTHTHPRRRQRSTSSSSGTLQPLADLQRKRRVEHHRGRVGRDRPRGVGLRVAQVDVRAALLLLLLLLEQRLRDGAPYAQRAVVAPRREHEGRRDGVVPGQAGKVIVDVLCLEGVQQVAGTAVPDVYVSGCVANSI